MTNFTKGPWYVVAGNENHGPYVTSDHADNNDICDLYHSDDNGTFWVKNGDDEALANANLIAAAPDMLEALEATKAFLNDVFGDDLPKSSDKDIYVRIKSAIAKAKGKTQCQ